MKIKLRRLLRSAVLVCTYTVLGTVLGAVSLYIYLLQSRPDLSLWHTTRLTEEYSLEKADEVRTFADYLALENRLFAELEEKIYRQVAGTEAHWLNRFAHGSLVDPTGFETNWNRSFELSPEEPVGGALLLHGLSDSPYSLRGLGNTLRARGYYVLGLRMPGHGTAPSGLVHSTWQDMAGAVELASERVSSRIGPQRPFTIIGYSMGAAQAVNYSLDALSDDSLRRPDSLVLLSPAIGVTGAAALAVWQSRFAWVAGLEKVAWNAIGPEYDPYKYTSFAVNAGDLMYRLTLRIESSLTALEREGRTRGFPRTLAFLSAVDATVSTAAVVDHLLARVENEGNELVIFDLNRSAEIAPFLRRDPGEQIRQLLAKDELRFDLTLVTNESALSQEVVARRRSGDDKTTRVEKAGLAWPAGVYSLSHVALPFAPEDAIYGSMPDSQKGFQIGLLDTKGEKGVLDVAASDILRLRHNPFYPYLVKRVEAFLGVERGADSRPARDAR